MSVLTRRRNGKHNMEEKTKKRGQSDNTVKEINYD